jgi:hypothetical protein
VALEGVDVSGGGLIHLRRLADLLGVPFAGAAPAHEGEDAHAEVESAQISERERGREREREPAAAANENPNPPLSLYLYAQEPRLLMHFLKFRPNIPSGPP